MEEVLFDIDMVNIRIKSRMRTLMPLAAEMTTPYWLMRKVTTM